MTHFFEMVPFYNGRFGGANPSPIVTELPNSNSEFVDICQNPIILINLCQGCQNDGHFYGDQSTVPK